MTMPEQKKVLITGSAGFIGDHLSRALIDKGWDVSLFDIQVNPAQNILNKEALKNAMEGSTHVVHLAAKTSVAESMMHPEETKEVNEKGTREVFAAAAAAGVKRVVYASSAAVYGDAAPLPNREDGPTDPLSPYAASKVQNEFDARDYRTPVIIGLRFFNVYGEGQRADHSYASVIPKWISAIKAGKQPQLFGDGEQSRDFVHIRDVVRVIGVALTKEGIGAGEVYNIGSGEERTMNSVWEVMKKASGSTIDITRSAPRDGDLRRSVADITKAKQDLGWEPKVPFEKGLKELFT
jgi:UDP-glucose 4-epimerase